MSATRSTRSITVFPDGSSRGTIYTIDDAWFEGSPPWPGGERIGSLFPTDGAEIHQVRTHSELEALLDEVVEQEKDPRRPDALVLQALLRRCQSRRLRLVVANFSYLEEDFRFSSEVNVHGNAVLLDIRDHTQPKETGSVAGILLAEALLAKNPRPDADLFFITSRIREVKGFLAERTSPWSLRCMPFVAKPVQVGDTALLNAELDSFMAYLEPRLPPERLSKLLADSMAEWYATDSTGHDGPDPVTLTRFPLYPFLSEAERTTPHGSLKLFFHADCKSRPFIGTGMLASLLHGLVKNVLIQNGSSTVSPSTEQVVPLPPPAPLFLFNLMRLLEQCQERPTANVSGAGEASGVPDEILFSTARDQNWHVQIRWANASIAPNLFAAFVRGKRDGAAGALRNILAWNPSEWKRKVADNLAAKADAVVNDWLGVTPDAVSTLPGYLRVGELYLLPRMNVLANTESEASRSTLTFTGA